MRLLSLFVIGLMFTVAASGQDTKAKTPDPDKIKACIALRDEAKEPPSGDAFECGLLFWSLADLDSTINMLGASSLSAQKERDEAILQRSELVASYNELAEQNQKLRAAVDADSRLFDKILAQSTAAQQKPPAPSAWRSFLGNFAQNYAQIQAAQQAKEIHCVSDSSAFGKSIVTNTDCH